MTDFLQSNFNIIQAKNKEIYDNTPEYVHRVAYSTKETNGINTDEECIKYYVDKKLPIDQIPEEERIPKYVEINGYKVKTDVVESSIAKILPLCNNYSTPGANVAPHRQRQRPIKGGISLINGHHCIVINTNPNDIFHITVGTLGGVVLDKKTNTLVGLTNNHVAILDATYGHLRNLNGQITNIVEPRKLRYFESNGSQFIENGLTPNTYPQSMVQFTEGSFSTLANAKIGRPKKYEPIYTNQTNYVDAALFTLDQGVIAEGVSNRQLGLESFTSNMIFATTSEINSCLGRPFMSAGRTTGPKSESCGITISSVGANLGVFGYNFQGARVAVNFADCIGIKYADGTLDPIGGGDSGSLAYAKIGEVWKVIGLVFAGSSEEGFICRIDRVVEALGIEAWDGSSKPLDSETPTTIVTPITETRKIIEQAGVRYWQGGIIGQGGGGESSSSSGGGGDGGDGGDGGGGGGGGAGAGGGGAGDPIWDFFIKYVAGVSRDADGRVTGARVVVVTFNNLDTRTMNHNIVKYGGGGLVLPARPSADNLPGVIKGANVPNGSWTGSGSESTVNSPDGVITCGLCYVQKVEGYTATFTVKNLQNQNLIYGMISNLYNFASSIIDDNGNIIDSPFTRKLKITHTVNENDAIFIHIDLKKSKIKLDDLTTAISQGMEPTISVSASSDFVRYHFNMLSLIGAGGGPVNPTVPIFSGGSNAKWELSDWFTCKGCPADIQPWADPNYPCSNSGGAPCDSSCDPACPGNDDPDGGSGPYVCCDLNGEIKNVRESICDCYGDPADPAECESSSSSSSCIPCETDEDCLVIYNEECRDFCCQQVSSSTSSAVGFDSELFKSLISEIQKTLDITE